MAQPSNLIGAVELGKHLDDPAWRIVDCRFDLADTGAGYRAYLESHIRGAVFADLDRDLSSPVGPGTGRHPLPDDSAFERFMGQIGLESTTEIVVYDSANGSLASRAWWLFRRAGHDRVRLLDGGFGAWLRAGGALASGNETVPPTRYRARLRRGRVLTTRDLLAVDDIRELRLLDAREPERFRGEAEPIDPIAGHIPGAMNLPLGRSVNEDGTWIPREQLESLWCDVLGRDKSKAWAVMCGSGVTACHLALSGVEAGYVEPRLYAGSWSEWIQEPGRPVAVGRG